MRGAVGRAAVPAPAVPGQFVALDALARGLEGAEFAPLRLATDRRERPASPRLPHALLLHLAHEARTVGVHDEGSAGIPAVHPDPARLAVLLGAEAGVVGRALDTLGRAGLVEAAEPTEVGGSGAMRLASRVLGSDPRCAALDWRAVATATAGSPSAWVAAHALAERLDPYDWTPVARGGLEHALGCGVSGVRAALERLVSAELVARREQRGGVSVYRFTELAWGRVEARAGATAASVAAPVAAPAPAARVAPAPVAPPPTPSPAAQGSAPAPHAAGGMRLVLGGVELELPAGCRAQVAIGPDGRPTVTLAGPAGGA